LRASTRIATAVRSRPDPVDKFLIRTSPRDDAVPAYNLYSSCRVAIVRSCRKATGNSTCIRSATNRNVGWAAYHWCCIVLCGDQLRAIARIATAVRSRPDPVDKFLIRTGPSDDAVPVYNFYSSRRVAIVRSCSKTSYRSTRIRFTADRQIRRTSYHWCCIVLCGDQLRAIARIATAVSSRPDPVDKFRIRTGTCHDAVPAHDLDSCRWFTIICGRSKTSYYSTCISCAADCDIGWARNHRCLRINSPIENSTQNGISAIFNFVGPIKYHSISYATFSSVKRILGSNFHRITKISD
jgi:hypothetical protein